MACKFIPVSPGHVRCVETGVVLIDNAFAKAAHEAAWEEKQARAKAAGPSTDKDSLLAEAVELVRAQAAELAALKAQQKARGDGGTK